METSGKCGRIFQIGNIFWMGIRETSEKKFTMTNGFDAKIQLTQKTVKVMLSAIIMRT